MTDATVRFGLLVSMFQAMLRDRAAVKKRKRFRTFLDRVYTGREYFSAIRLILPGLDRERGTYGLKESALAACLVDALGLAKDSPDALRLINWRKGGARSGANAGNFALVAAEVLQCRQGMVSGGLTIKELNDMLDQLASTENKGEKASVLSSLIKKTNALEMKWILMIILKDLKLGISEKSIFHEFHLDAEDLFNVTCDLKLVCEKLKDRTQRQKKQDIEVGKPVRPQLAMRVSDAMNAWKKLHGKNVVVECKFDGDRIQIHKNGEEIHYFSRNFLDHTEYAHGMSNIIIQNVLVDRCILDGEMLVWDTSTQRFAEFGSNQEIAKAAREGLESYRQLCSFDILYVGDTSVIHQSLMERHSLMQKVVRPLKGRLEILVPNGEPCWSVLANSVEDVERFFKATVENRDEGIVLKDLGSKWEPSDRSGKWLKLKPDYIHAGSDLDVLIIGGYFGSGRRGGEVSQFLVGLAELSETAGYPKRFISFCRVGSGLADEELNSLVAKLKPYFRKNEYPKSAPHCYVVTNNSKERPDVWIESPDKSVILSINSDIRTVKSEVFMAPYGLRFPRITRVRYDKPWHDCLDLQSFVELVQSSNGNTWRTNHPGLQSQNPKRTKTTKRGTRKNVSVISAHFIQTGISNIQEETFIFANMVFYFINAPQSLSMDHLHKTVVENGGAFSMNLNDSVTHCIAAEKKGFRYQAAVHHGDVIHYSWVLDCCKQKRLLHLQPKYFLHFSGSSRGKLVGEIDAFSDCYYIDIDVTDIKQIFNNMVGTEESNKVEHYKSKYCPLQSLCFFRGCCIYVVEWMPSVDLDCKATSELVLRRLKLEITMYAGEVCDSLIRATHLIVYSQNERYNFDDLYNSFPLSQRRFLHQNKLHIVRHRWLEDSMKESKKLNEDAYSLKPESLESIEIDESENGVQLPASTSTTKNYNATNLVGRTEARKRARAPHRTTGKAKPRQTKRQRTRVGRRAAKIDKDESLSSDSEESNQEATELNETKHTGIERTKACDPLGQVGLPDKYPLELINKQDSVENKPELDVNSGQHEKLEQMADPLHAILLDMIPSLSQRKVEGESSAVEGKIPQIDNDANPVKKKKLSYKEVAGHLLKDW
ncbi:DNA ligase 4-like isoform X2 [Zingiber officinale]|uniref:DNA ligase 4-like isoform X2 n=1 Tax=Zingiber officinale TaxID=94328 RepID=UPI001C4AE4E5|nr:DNA ligase 4-like isoform X2 [Zingiber officinale]